MKLLALVKVWVGAVIKRPGSTPSPVLALATIKVKVDRSYVVPIVALATAVLLP